MLPIDLCSKKASSSEEAFLLCLALYTKREEAMSHPILASSKTAAA